ncbi:oxidoreductase [Aliidongia dinghuensis]|uniref:Oxidoreductase n=1 Tax=Aliidongia dinghuensis TaxID=1867774 RepID=A0A8J2Z078_9PROT|nr:FAD-binding oxidoreductase [Aliidongia dinghuensis]GGF43727.1 oxidoreductase [Aliidongia dinghuensis]
MLGNDRSHGLWELTAPPAPDLGPLAEPQQVDVAIIGGGYTGISAALHLAEGGATVAVLEAVDVGYGGAGRNVGLVNAGMWVMPDYLAGTLGDEYGERLLSLLGNAPSTVFDLVEKHQIDCELVRAGTLHCAVGQKGLRELEQRAEQWSRRGARVELLNADDTRRKVGSSAYAASLLDHRAGTIQPLAYVRGLAKAAVGAGARIFTGSPVIDARQSGGRWTLSTKLGSVTADWVLVATDAYANGPWSEVKTEQVHLPYFNFATTPLGSNVRASILPERQGGWDTNEVLTSFRLDKAGRLVFGSVGALRGAGASIHRSWARRALRKLFPQVGDISFEAEWYGLIGMTADNLPRFHRLAQNVISFSGYNGRGIAPGTVFGKTAANYILGKLSERELPLPVSDVSQPRFAWAKEAFYEAGAQIVHMTAARW